MKFWHWHKWAYLAEPVSGEREQNLMIAMGYKNLSEQRFYRYCIKCRKFQALDIDGWCNYLSKEDEYRVQERLGLVST